MILLFSAVFFGCGTLPNGRRWEQEATLLPGWQRIRKAAVDAICAPEIWVPAGSALILQVGDMDNELSDWAVEKTAVYFTLVSRNIKATQLPGMLTNPLQIGTLALDAGTAWARVEGERHYPSDVLAGMAIGHFFGAFITDAFLGLDYKGGAGITVEPSRNGFKLPIFWSY